MDHSVITHAQQVRDYDAAVMAATGISPLELMERAASAFANALPHALPPQTHPRVDVLCGPGNNGGDGAAIARMLGELGYRVQAYGYWRDAEARSGDLAVNWDRLSAETGITLHVGEDYAAEDTDADVVIDAMFGVGLSRQLSGEYLRVAASLNAAARSFQVISVDVPSGQPADGSSPAWPCVSADRTYTFVALKQAALLPETGPAWGATQVLALDGSAPEVRLDSPVRLLTPAPENALLAPRRRFTHKGTYGHVLVIAGSRGHAGAALLCGRGAYRAGAGLVTFYAPSCLEAVLQSGLPEAMVLRDPESDLITTIPDLSPYDAVAVGPGLGRDERTAAALGKLFAEAGERLVVVDADALNHVAERDELRAGLPPHVVLTPHPGEFARMAGPFADGHDRLLRLTDYAGSLGAGSATVVLKDQYSAVCSSTGELAFNYNAGNPGMATGGSGDVLTGVIAGLGAQLPRSPDHEAQHMSWTAATTGVMVHAEAGDLAAELRGHAGLLAGDIADQIGVAIEALGQAANPVSLAT